MYQMTLLSTPLDWVIPLSSPVVIVIPLSLHISLNFSDSSPYGLLLVSANGSSYLSVSSNSLGNFSDSSNGFFYSSVFFGGFLQRLLQCLILPLHVCLHECFKLLTYFLEWIKLFVCPFQLFKHWATPIKQYIYSCVSSNGLYHIQ